MPKVVLQNTGMRINFFKCHLLHCFISEKERGVFSNYREPHLAEIIQDAEKPEGDR